MHVHGALFALINIVLRLVILRVPGARARGLVAALGLGGLLMPTGILAEVYLGLPPVLVILGGLSLFASVALAGVALPSLLPACRCRPRARRRGPRRARRAPARQQRVSGTCRGDRRKKAAAPLRSWRAARGLSGPAPVAKGWAFARRVGNCTDGVREGTCRPTSTGPRVARDRAGNAVLSQESQQI